MPRPTNPARSAWPSLCWWRTRFDAESAGELADPVDFPGLAAVGREGLLHVRRLGRDAAPDVADEHHASLPELLVEQLQMVARQAAHQRRSLETAFVQLEPVDAPLVCLRVVHPQGLRLD